MYLYTILNIQAWIMVRVAVQTETMIFFNSEMDRVCRNEQILHSLNPENRRRKSAYSLENNIILFIFQTKRPFAYIQHTLCVFVS